MTLPKISFSALLAGFACLTMTPFASAELSDGQGVLVECHVDSLVFNENRVQFTCDTNYFEHDELRAHMELRFDQSSSVSNDRNLWTTERAIDLLAAAPRDDQDRPVLRFNLMYLEARTARIMDVRAVWSQDTQTTSDPDNPFSRVLSDNLNLGNVLPELTEPNSDYSLPATPNDFQGLVMACHVRQIALYQDMARFTCADGHNPDWAGLNDQIDIRYSQSDSHMWMAERAIDLLASSPRDDENNPILHFNIMYRGSGSPAYAMDVRTQY